MIEFGAPHVMASFVRDQTRDIPTEAPNRGVATFGFRSRRWHTVIAQRASSLVSATFTALIAEPSYHRVPFAATRGGRRNCNIRGARRQSASACTHRPRNTRVDRAPCDRTMGRNCPKSALYLVAIACASTFFLHGERTCAGAPCLVSITLARSHVGASTLNSGLLHFCAILMMRKRYFPTALSKNTMFARIVSYVRPSKASTI
jgi:hypothetical protein